MTFYKVRYSAVQGSLHMGVMPTHPEYPGPCDSEFSHSNSLTLLGQLRWLPVELRTRFKLACLTYKNPHNKHFRLPSTTTLSLLAFRHAVCDLRYGSTG